MQTDPMSTMKSCYGDSCECVPEEVMDAVYDSLKQLPGDGHQTQKRDARAELLAPLMAEQGWRFCPFDLVHTNLANRLAHKVALQSAA